MLFGIAFILKLVHSILVWFDHRPKVSKEQIVELDRYFANKNSGLALAKKSYPDIYESALSAAATVDPNKEGKRYYETSYFVATMDAKRSIQKRKPSYSVAPTSALDDMIRSTLTLYEHLGRASPGVCARMIKSSAGKSFLQGIKDKSLSSEDLKAIDNVAAAAGYSKAATSDKILKVAVLSISQPVIGRKLTPSDDLLLSQMIGQNSSTFELLNDKKKLNTLSDSYVCNLGIEQVNFILRASGVTSGRVYDEIFEGA
jgi:hypothetical protein